MKTSGVELSCKEGLVRSKESWDRRREVKVGAEDCASAAEEFRPFSAQECKVVFALQIYAQYLEMTGWH